MCRCSQLIFELKKLILLALALALALAPGGFITHKWHPRNPLYPYLQGAHARRLRPPPLPRRAAPSSVPRPSSAPLSPGTSAMKASASASTPAASASNASCRLVHDQRGATAAQAAVNMHIAIAALNHVLK